MDFLSFCNWNLNTLSKDDSYGLLQAHNTNYNYDLISLYETGLSDTVQGPVVLSILSTLSYKYYLTLLAMGYFGSIMPWGGGPFDPPIRNQGSTYAG